MKCVSIIVSTLQYLFKCEKNEWIHPQTPLWIGLWIWFMQSLEVKQTKRLRARCLLSPLSHFFATALSCCPCLLRSSPCTPPHVGSENHSFFLVMWLHINWSVGSCWLPSVSLYSHCKLFVCESWTHFSYYGRAKVVGGILLKPRQFSMDDFICPLNRPSLNCLLPGPV